MKRRSDHNELALILGLLFLGLLNKGPFAARPGAGEMMPGRGTTEMPGRGTMDTPPGRSQPTGENENPAGDMGANSRSSPGSETQNMPGGGSGVPDKSKNNSPPMGPIVTADMKMPSTYERISPTPPTGGMVLPSGQVFIPGLNEFGQTTGGPGSGPYDPSITTVYGSTSYTNANLTQLAKDIDAKNQELFNYYSGKETAHPIPVMAAQPGPTMKNAADMPVMAKALPGMMPMPTMKETAIPGAYTPPTMKQMLNVMDPNFLSRLIQSGLGVGQNVLNQFLSGAEDIFATIGKQTPFPGVPVLPGGPVITPQIVG